MSSDAVTCTSNCVCKWEMVIQSIIINNSFHVNLCVNNIMHSGLEFVTSHNTCYSCIKVHKGKGSQREP